MMDKLTKSLFAQDRKMQRAIFGISTVKKKRVKLTPGQRLKVWENPKLYGRKCSICGGKIIKQSDMELDHTHPYSKGGGKMNLAHKDCNRIKGSKSLKHIQKKWLLKQQRKKQLRKNQLKKEPQKQIIL